MENLIFLLTASLVLYKSSKQPRRTRIGDTNCSLLFSPDASFDFTKSKDGDQLYFSEYTEKQITYGVLCARLAEPLPMDEASEVLNNYLNRLRKPFYALYNTGADMCEYSGYKEECVKIIDYWQDEYQLDWKVKGYTDGQTIAVLYVKNITALNVEKQDEFLDSFYF
jgi:hypothetical protein